MLTYILFVLGFILLIKGADWLVEGSASLAKKFRISDMLIGLTIVSIGTSAPELIVNILASFKGSAEIAIGNVFGSNISNVLLILGITAIIYPIPIKKDTIRTDLLFVLIATLAVGFFANAHIGFSITPKIKHELFIGFWDGVFLLLVFMLFLSYAIKMSKRATESNNDIKEKPLSKSIIFILIGIVCLFFGGKWVVDGAVLIARLFNMSEGFIGLTIVAIGTSLPELVTSIIAARKHNVDIAVGNVIGSNIFNLLWVIGISALINPLGFDAIYNFDIMVMLLSTILILMLISKKTFSINRNGGLILLLSYIAYLSFLFYRG